ncbi:hypothetical protein NFI96_019480, partial [Prochilodus magdalenae]
LRDPWRSVNWSDKEKILKDLGNLKPHLKPLRILLYGPVGAGKSCFINSVQRALIGRNVSCALENSAASGQCCTVSIKTHRMKQQEGGYYPFGFCDIMGFETYKGIHAEDVIKVLEGHVLDDYEFNPPTPITEDNPKYKQRPKPRDKIHCLVSIVPADVPSRMNFSLIYKTKAVQKKASKLNIPQVVVLTKVDNACDVVNCDLRKLYHSRKIRDKLLCYADGASTPAQLHFQRAGNIHGKGSAMVGARVGLTGAEPDHQGLKKKGLAVSGRVLGVSAGFVQERSQPRGREMSMSLRCGLGNHRAQGWDIPLAQRR